MHQTTTTSLARSGAAALLGLLLAGCITTAGPDPETCAQPMITVGLALDAEGLEPGTPAVCRDQEVRLSVESEVDGLFHIHGYDAELPAFEVRAGVTTEAEFVAARSGQFPIEFHLDDDPRGVDVGVFTVHEP